MKIILEWKISLILFAMAAACWLGFAAIGSSVDAQGFLHEPFFLLPVAAVLCISALVAGVIGAVRKHLL